MHNQNPIHQAIRQVMKPVIENRRMSVQGSIQAIDYYKNTARIYWRDPQSGAERENANVPLPIDGDGIFKPALEQGDEVTLDFKHGNIESPYITSVHKRFRGVNYQSKNGAGIPKGIGML
jgi:hypothetical protein